VTDQAALLSKINLQVQGLGCLLRLVDNIIPAMAPDAAAVFDTFKDLLMTGAAVIHLVFQLIMGPC